jgi:hypothetical protein
LTSPVLPHTFPTLRGGTTSLVFAGSGLSARLAPLAGELLRDKGPAAEAALGITTKTLTKAAYKPEELYAWAELVLSMLEKDTSVEVPRLKLAEAMGLDTIPEFGVDPSTAPSKLRHRILARFVREGLLDQVWTVNWDCHIENALAMCGMPEAGVDNNVPWRSAQRVVVLPKDVPATNENNTVGVFKPHGCVRALRRATLAKDIDEKKELASRFMITTTDLERTATTDPKPIYSTLAAEISKAPMIAVGWAVSEKYLRKYIKEQCAQARPKPSAQSDILSCVALDWEAGHGVLAEVYKTTKDKAFVQVVKPDDQMCTDNLLKWVQALYGLDVLIEVAHADDQASLRPLLTELETVDTGSLDVIQPALTWFDSFLPYWTRYCWRQGLVQFTHRGKSLDLATVNMGSPEEWIPLRLTGRHVEDLASAAYVLAKLLERNRLGRYDYTWCEGLLYDDAQPDSITALLPFASDQPANDLASRDSWMARQWRDRLAGTTNVRVCLVPIRRGTVPTPIDEKHGIGVIRDALETSGTLHRVTYSIITPGDL